MSEMRRLYQELYAQLSEQRSRARALQQQKQQAGAELESQRQAVVARYDGMRSSLEASLHSLSAYQRAAEMYYRPGSFSAVSPVYVSDERIEALYEQFHQCPAGLKPDYARRLHEAVSSARLYLTARRDELQHKQEQELSMLANERETISGDDILRACNRIIDSDQMSRFAQLLQRAGGKYDAAREDDPTACFTAERVDDLYLGLCKFPLPAPGPCRSSLAMKLGQYYDAASQSALVPYPLPDVLFVRCSGARVDDVFSAVRMLMYHILRSFQPLPGRVFYVDARAMDGARIHPFEQFAGADGFLSDIPQNQHELGDSLRHLRALVRDKQQRFLIYRDFGAAGSEDLQWLCNNGASYGLKVVVIQDLAPDNRLTDALPPYLPSNHVVQLLETADGFVINGQQKRPFSLCAFRGSLPTGFVQKVAELYKPAVRDMRLFSAFPPAGPGRYTRNRQQDIRVPLGIGSQTGKTYDLRLDHEQDFAAYLLGAAGSGKTTLIHTLISGVLMNYHPDDVELWLADFSVAIFSQYITNCAPHIRYVLMDDSPEQVYSFIDRIDQEAEKRRKLFNDVSIKTGKTVNKLEELPPEYYLPKVLVIIDEFLIFSKIAAGPDSHDGASYRSRFTEIIVGHRKYGFRFLFSGQSYDSGLAVVADEARKNISTRIALPADKADITALMDVSMASMKPEWAWNIEHLPAHHALVSTRRDKAQISEPVSLFYLDDNDLVRQAEFIQNVARVMHPVQEYTPDDPLAYVEKHPVLINATQPVFFQTHGQQMKEDYQAWCVNPAHREGDLLLYPGEPKNLTLVRHVLLAPESKQQVVLYGQYTTNLTDIASVVYSAVRSAKVQKADAEVWAAASDLLQNRYGRLWEGRVEVRRHIRQIDRRMDVLLEQMRKRIVSPCLIVVAGLEEMLREYEDELEEEAFFETGSGGHAGPQQSGEIDMAAIRALIQQNQQNGGISYDAAGGGGFEPAPGKSPGEMVEEVTRKLRFLFDHGSRYGIYLLYITDRPSRLKNAGLREECFGHSFVFPGTWTIDECALPVRMALRQLSSTSMFVHQSGDGLSNYAAFCLDGQ